MSENRSSFPKEYPPYRIFWNWELTHDCNYRCSYCETWRDDVKTPEYVEPSEWKEIWDRIFDIYYTCLVRFSGGEPSVYPGFIDIVSAVAEKHSVDITTNLSFDVKEFVKKVTPGNVAVSASFHSEFNDIHDFLERVLYLHNNGIISTICYVAYPPHLDRLQHYKSVVEEKNIMFKFLPFTGEYNGKKYPEEYTDEEKALMEDTAHAAKDETARELNTNWYEWNAEKRDSEEGVQKTELCRMGQMYAMIHTDGHVTRCCGAGSQVLGNIRDKDFRLLEDPMPCDVEHCPCFKAMLVDNEAKWKGMWDALPHKKYKIPIDAQKENND